jgi:hypothetical protein
MGCFWWRWIMGMMGLKNSVGMEVFTGGYLADFMIFI